MSSSNATLYYTAIDDMFKDLLLDTSTEQQVTENEAPLTATPKRMVRIRKQNLFAKEMEEDFVICRRLPEASNLSPSTQELRKERQGEELLRLRRQRWEAEQKKPMRRLTMRI
ncbi:uncharacterized protein LOC111595039 [Drosophila hydei]|uniref:Uncharacterized protein LOC111595039 n=1 Tax=Drosophila hydei TaxID=7224 RepID=A0A6J1LFM5_DROHY|nr:uncharacterized protein LOC111595039 [Drosophila hydei]